MSSILQASRPCIAEPETDSLAGHMRMEGQPPLQISHTPPNHRDDFLYVI